MSETVKEEDARLLGVWALWCIRSRKPGVRFELPPMPPLEEWPDELLEMLERVTGKTIVKK